MVSHQSLIRELLVLPFRRFLLDTELSHEEVTRRLDRIVEPGSPFLGEFKPTNKIFGGQVSPRGFKIMRLIPYGNSFLPVVIGRFCGLPEGTRVQVTMRPTVFVSVFMGFWFAILTLGLAFTLIFPQATSSGAPPVATLAVLTAMSLLAYVMMAVCFGLEARKARGLIEETLQPIPSERVQEVLAGRGSRIPRVVRSFLIAGAITLPVLFIAAIVRSCR